MEQNRNPRAPSYTYHPWGGVGGLISWKCPSPSRMTHSRMGASGSLPANPAPRAWPHLLGREKHLHIFLEPPPRGPDWSSRLWGAHHVPPPVSTNSGLLDTCAAPRVAMGMSGGGECVHTGPWAPRGVHTSRAHRQAAGKPTPCPHACTRTVTHPQLCVLSLEMGPVLGGRC